MKKNLILILPVAAAIVLLTGFQPDNQTPPADPVSQGDEFKIPEDITAIFDKSCFGCHNKDSQSEKARNKLLIDELAGLSKAKLVGKLGEIEEVLEKNEMPPEKFITKYPDKELTEEESIRVQEWAEAAAIELMK